MRTDHSGWQIELVQKTTMYNPLLAWSTTGFVCASFTLFRLLPWLHQMLESTYVCGTRRWVSITCALITDGSTCTAFNGWQWGCVPIVLRGLWPQSIGEVIFSEGVIKRLLVFVLNELATAVLTWLFHTCTWYFVKHKRMCCVHVHQNLMTWLPELFATGPLDKNDSCFKLVSSPQQGILW